MNPPNRFWVFPQMPSPRSYLYAGDCLDLIKSWPDSCVDALITDPPAGISFMGKDWDNNKGGRDEWVAWLAGVMREALRVLKPGAYGLVWALPRTSHWTGWALESAGFEVRDRVSHLFGTGFPKSLDVSKALDAAAGAEREVVGKSSRHGGGTNNVYGVGMGDGTVPVLTAPATDLAKQWDGWGTALKPACEDWWLVRKPLEGTVAANVAAHGTGALNIDGCRIGTNGEVIAAPQSDPSKRAGAVGADLGISGADVARFKAAQLASIERTNTLGRWPANITLDEEAAALLDAQSGHLGGAGNKRVTVSERTGSPDAAVGDFAGSKRRVSTPALDAGGGASRFFYVAKPSGKERDAGCEHLPARTGGEATDREDDSAGVANPRAGAGRGGGRRNFHPTVKSIALMRWLCRLITPADGVVLDPFAGSGSTGVACAEEGFRFVGIESAEEYLPIAYGRLDQAFGRAA